MKNKTRHYFGEGCLEKMSQEYDYFKKCLPQLIDSSEITGDLEGRWIIFKDGWVYGLASYESSNEARDFARQMFRDEPGATWIVVKVDLEQHGVSVLHLLGDALSELDTVEDE